MPGWLATVCSNAAVAILLAMVIWVAGLKSARRGGWLGRQAHLCFAGMIAAMVFAGLSLRLAPGWFESEPLQTVEQLARLVFAVGIGLAVHELLLRALIRP